MKCDLHIHTCYSFDATESVDTILDMAEKKGIQLLSVSDHNEIEGSLEMMRKAPLRGIEAISGIEIDCFFHNNVIHLLGYGCDLTDPDFERLKQHYLGELKRIGKERLQKINEHYGFELDEQKIIDRAQGRPYTNVQITQVMLETQKHPDLEIYQTGTKSRNPIANFYWDNLAYGRWGYTEMVLPDYTEVIDFVHRTHGVLIVAHPVQTIGLDYDACDELVEAGADGFEVYSSYHDTNAIQFYREYCERKDLIQTFGSDFHGSVKPNIDLGQTGYELDCSDQILKLKKSRV